MGSKSTLPCKEEAARESTKSKEPKTQLDLFIAQKLSALRTLQSSEDIWRFKLAEICTTNEKLEAFDSAHAAPLDTETWRSVVHTAFETGMGWEILDDEWERLTQRSLIIAGSKQRIRDYCIRQGNTKNHCICALECNPETGMQCRPCGDE